MKFHFLYILIILNLINTTNEDCSKWQNDHLTLLNNGEYFNQTIYLVQFSDYTDIVNTTCDQLKINVTTFGIRPTVSTILFEINFDLYQLFNLFNVDRESRQKIDFLNFKGFNQQQQNLFVNKFLKAYTIDIKDTKFRFYLDNKQIEANMCVSENFNQSYFGPIKDMFFSADVIYEQNICPYIFLNTQLNFLSLSGITNSLLFKNRLSFLTLNQNQTRRVIHSLFFN